MKLETVRIKRFRSVEEVSLEDIGELNVLIGKNSSGKSNVLFAIDSFFACIKGGSLVTAEAPFGTEIDYFERCTEEPIEIEMSFKLCMPSICRSRELTNANSAVEETSCASGALRGNETSARAELTTTVRTRKQIRTKVFIGSSGVCFLVFVTCRQADCHERNAAL